MKSFEALEKAFKKELELSEKHKQNALDIKKEIELQRGKALSKKINSLNLSGQEYDRFLRLLDGKNSFLEAVELVLGEKNTESAASDEKSEEEGRLEEQEGDLIIEREEERGQQKAEV